MTLWRWFATAAATLTALIFVTAFWACPDARADGTYHAELASGWSTPPVVNDTFAVSGPLAGESELEISDTGANGAPDSTVSWSAPNGTQFNGFAYTAANFDAGAASTNSAVTGAWSAGLWGWNGSEPIVFPATYDCSVHGSLSTGGGPTYWTSFNNGGLAGISHVASCSSSGNTSGWGGSTNYEVNESTGANVTGAEYGQLTLRDSCDAVSCTKGDIAEADVENLSAMIDDPQSEPTESQNYWSNGSSSGWYTTLNSASSRPTLDFNATDPSGICWINVQLTGTNGGTSTSSGDLVATPGTVNPGGSIGEEFANELPCDMSQNYQWTLPSTLTSGNYSEAIWADDAAEYEGGNFTDANTDISSAHQTINIDNTIPAVQILAPTAADPTVATANVEVGPSGIGSLSCTNAGRPIPASEVNLLSGSTTVAGTSTWSVADANGTGISCTVSNNDQNGALSSTTISYSDPGNTQGVWEPSDQSVAVTAAAYDNSPVPVGVCIVNDAPVTAVGTYANQTLDINVSGQDTAGCVSNDSNSSTYSLWVDTQQPTVTFTGAAATAAAKGTYVSGTPTIDLTGEEATTLSGVAKVVCTVNGGDKQTLQPTAAGDWSADFILANGNGNQAIACTPTSGAGVTGATATETVKVDDSKDESGSGTLTAYGSSPSLDNAGDPYSNGPSQTAWLHGTQTVTVTADHTGGASPITSLSCTGATFQGGQTTVTIPQTGANTYDNGLRTTLSVVDPGGDIACVATDSAGDTFAVGDYQIHVDDTAPTGSFVPQSQWPEPNALELDVTDPNFTNASGVATVAVYANSASTGTIYLGEATAVGGSLYRLTVNDATIPDGTYTLTARATDHAGNTGTIFAAGNGSGVATTSPEVVTMPLRDQVKLNAAAGVVDSNGRVIRTVNTAQLPVEPTSVANANVLSAHQALPASWNGHRLSAAARSAVSIAHAARHTATVNVPTVALAAGQAITLHGTLTDVTRHRAIAGGTIRAYQQIQGQSNVTLVGSARTGQRGGWQIQIRGGVDRTILITYTGSKTQRPVAAEINETYPATITLSSRGAFIHGRMVTLAGRVLGGYIPSGGVTYQIWYMMAGHGWVKWIQGLQTNKSGSWSYRFRLGAPSGLTYKFQVRADRQADWPFRDGVSPTITRTIG